MVDSPSGRVPENASRWDHGRTEAGSGGKIVSNGSLLIWGFMGIYGSGIRSNRAAWDPQAQAVRSHRVSLWLSRRSSGHLTNVPGSLLVKKKSP